MPATGALFGAAVSGKPDLDVVSSVTALESSIGRKFDVHRLYDLWDDPQPTTLSSWTVSNGRTPVVSINALRRNGTTVRWADIAAGREDARIRSQALGIRALNAPVFLALHHEPENDPGHGTPAEYVAAWRHYVDVFRSEGVSNVSFTWILMAWTFERSSMANAFYPGDDVVDWIAADGYNWFGTGPDKEWRPLAAALGAFNTWAASHGKPLMLAEYGSLEDPNVTGRKADWISAAAAALENAFPAIKAVLYFHAPVTFPWWIDSSGTSVAAFAAMGQLPYFHTVPEAALRISPARGPAPLSTVLSGGDSYPTGATDLQWRLDFGDGSAPLLTSTPPEDIAHDYPAGTYAPTLRVSDPSGELDVTTGSVTALSPPTAVTAGNTNVKPTSASLNGRVNPNGLETTAWFSYGTTTAYGSATGATSAGAGTKMVAISAAMTGLTPNTLYHYRMSASNAASTTTGSDGTFTTSGAPAATTAVVGAVTAATADVVGFVDANLLATDSWFEYGLTPGYGMRTGAIAVGSGGSKVRVAMTLSGLRANTVYHYRTAARNSFGTSYGENRTLTTAGPAAVSTGGASGITANAVNIGGNVDPNGLATSYRVEYGATLGYGSASTWRSAGSAMWGSGVSVLLSGLVSKRLYHYRIVGTNSAGTTYGTDRIFTTR